MDIGGAPRIAIVGMACRLPGAGNVGQFWENLRDGVESVRRLTRQELLDAGATPDDLDDPRHVPYGALLDHVDRFDAAFFGISTREAELMDPQQRLFLQCAWEALEDAGYDPGRITVPVGVFGGANFNSYLTENLIRADVFDDKSAALQAVLVNDKDYLATRVAYKLNLRGPACAVQSGCSTSLVAVHLAAQTLLGYQCDMALAGGVAVDTRRSKGYWAHEGSVFSPDGHCRAFDADARGTVFGNGVGIVVLKRLDDALRDGDSISAVILGSAVNNDGAVKVGFTAPSVTGQAEVIAEALADAGVGPESIGYVETHGTGTPIGDPIEVEALRKAYGERPGYARCAIGSVKTNVGHLDSAAGVASLIKTALALRHAALPPSINFSAPNPKIDFARTAFYVNTTLTPWTSGTRAGLPRRAAVSSFGMGGTNAHVVLEEAPQAPLDPRARDAELLVWSARSATALDAFSDRLAAYLASESAGALADVACTLQTGRAAFEHRRMVVAGSTAEAAALIHRQAADVSTSRYTGESRRVAFVFPGRVPDAARVTAELYGSDLVFRSAVDECRDELRAHAAAGADPAVALFVLQYALTCVWKSWGITPAAVHSDGRGALAAACATEAMSCREALRALIRCVPPGSDADGYNGVGVEHAAEPGSFHYLEIGAGDSLAELSGGAVATGCLPRETGSPSAIRSMLTALGRLWQAGVTIDWPGVHAGTRRRRISLPTYAFDVSRYWIDPPEEEASPTPEALANRRREDPAEWLYVPTWQRMPAAEVVARALQPAGSTQWLVCAGDSLVSHRVAERLLRIAPHTCVVRGRIGAAYMADPNGSATIDPTDATHYARLLGERMAGASHVVVVHLWSRSAVDPASRPDAAAVHPWGLHSVLALAKALAADSLRRISLRVVTVDAHDVLGSEDLSLTAAPMLAALRVLAQEQSNVDCASIDLDRTSASDPAQVDWLADRLVVEASTLTPDPVVAYRGRARWVPRYQPVPLQRPASTGIIRNGATYLILGGFGRIGSTLAEHLARTARVNLVLVGRTAADASSHNTQRVAALERLGAHVLTVAADVASEPELAHVVATTERRFGRIDGVIVAAGAVDSGAFRPLTDLTPAEYARQLRPKTDGLLALERALGDRPLDFCLVVSSLSSVLGGLGYGAYSAANLSLDAFVRRHNQTHGRRWITVNWDAWRWSEGGEDVPGAALGRLALSPPEAVDAFDRILGVARAIDQVIVSTASLDARLDQWVNNVGARGAVIRGDAMRPDTAAAATADPPVSGDVDREPLTPAQRAIVETWQRVLGIPHVPLDESFLDLGGNSLTAVQAISGLEQSLGVHVAIEEFIFQTAAQLAALCDRKLASGAAPPVKAPARGLLDAFRGALVRS